MTEAKKKTTKNVKKKIKDKSTQKRPLTIKQLEFIDAYLETKNATEAADRIYLTKNRQNSGILGHTTLNSPAVQEEIQKRLSNAKKQIYRLSQEAKSENVRLSASQDIVDRQDGKAVQKVIQAGIQLNADINQVTDDELDKIIQGATL